MSTDDELYQPGQLSSLPDLDSMMADLKHRSTVRQVVAAALLTAAAALAIWASPTAAIVFAILSIAAVWMLPAGRRALRAAVVLRDDHGTARLLATLDEGGAPLFVLADSDGRTRLLLGLSEQGSPAIGLLDDHGATRFSAMFNATVDAPYLQMTDPSGAETIGISGATTGALLVVSTADTSSCISPGSLWARDAGSMIGMEMQECPSLTLVQGDTSVHLRADHTTFTGLMAQEKERVVLAAIAGDRAILEAFDELAVAKEALVGQGASART